MIQINEIFLPLGYRPEDIPSAAAKALGVKPEELRSVRLIRRSVDARRKSCPHFSASVCAETDCDEELLRSFPKNKVSPYREMPYEPPKALPREKSPVVTGFGPAGMFAALTLAQSGLKPIILERGQDCAKRIKAVEAFHSGGALDEESNVQFGEGGAGTFSDGKLTTGIRDPRIRHIFRTFVRFGAPEEILWLAKPHIGTDLLRTVVQNLRKEIIRLGGTVLFGARLTDLGIKNGKITSAIYQHGEKTEEIETDSIILAVGHSARDTFGLLLQKNVEMAQKSFSMGLRIEHLQREVNRSLYGDFADHPALPPAEYKYAVHLPDNRTLYTFCMCPGGYVVGAASEKESAVTNGMSLFARDGRNANSALLVNTEPRDFGSDHVLAGMELQRKTERAAFRAGGGLLPCTTAEDLLKNRLPRGFGGVSPTALPGTAFAKPEDYLPGFICAALREGLPLLAKKADFFRAPDAVLTGAETRSSSPVRILRGENMCSPSADGLYPCGEGAGYAGGIVSAAADGIRCAEALIERSV